MIFLFLKLTFQKKNQLSNYKLHRLKHSSAPNPGEEGSFFLIDSISSCGNIYVLCNAISGNSNDRVLTVTTP